MYEVLHIVAIIFNIFCPRCAICFACLHFSTFFKASSFQFGIKQSDLYCDKKFNATVIRNELEKGFYSQKFRSVECRSKLLYVVSASWMLIVSWILISVASWMSTCSLGCYLHLGC